YNYRFEYVDVLNERRITDSLGNVSIVTLDDRGLPICEIDALGGRTSYEYDEAGRTTLIIDPAGRRTQDADDDSGKLLQIARPGRARPTFRYADHPQPGVIRAAH